MKPRYKIDRKLRREIKAKPCAVCGTNYMVDPCHIRTFGSSGLEEWFNIIPMCRVHHNEQEHDLKWLRFCEKYPHIRALLKELGWVFLHANGAWKLFNEKYPHGNN